MSLLIGVTQENLYPVSCMDCMWGSYGNQADLVNVALWPADTGFKVFIDFNIMFLMSIMQYNSPPLSLGSMLASLKFMPSLSGIVSIKPSTLVADIYHFLIASMMPNMVGCWRVLLILDFRILH